jgi:hypothetical protein
LRVGEPLLRRLFQQIGDAATEGIATAVQLGLASTYPDRVVQS